MIMEHARHFNAHPHTAPPFVVAIEHAGGISKERARFFRICRDGRVTSGMQGRAACPPGAESRSLTFPCSHGHCLIVRALAISLWWPAPGPVPVLLSGNAALIGWNSTKPGSIHYALIKADLSRSPSYNRVLLLWNEILL